MSCAGWAALVALAASLLAGGCRPAAPAEPVRAAPAGEQHQDGSGAPAEAEATPATVEPVKVSAPVPPTAEVGEPRQAAPRGGGQARAPARLATPDGHPETEGGDQPAGGPTPRSTPAARPASGSELVERLLARMSLEQKVGQLFMVGVAGTVPDTAGLSLVRELQPGGVILFSRNTETPAQVRALVERLQREARAQPPGIPLFVSLDQEGGLVGRVSRGVTLLPGNMALGAAGDAELARAAGRVLARELAAMGVSMDLAPVVDVNSNPANPVIGTRSFGSSPEQVAALGRAMVAGLQEGGVAAVAKHFPGHGDTSLDSHHDLPIVEHDHERLEQVELVPFRAVIAEGVEAIMTAHVALPALDGRRDSPATLSSRVLTDLLRDHLGFRGLVLTDALEMAAIKERVGVAQGVLEAFKAGSDILLITGIEPEELAALRAAYRALLEAARTGEIPAERLEASTRRILEAKARRGLLAGAGGSASEEVVDAEAHQAIAERIAAASITLVRAQTGLLPLDPGQSILVVRPSAERSSPAEGPPSTGALGAAVRELAPSATELLLPVQPSASDIERAVARARRAARVVVGSYDAWRWPRQQALIKALLASGTPTVVVGLRTPYDLLALPQIGTYLAAYSDRPASLRAVALALFGRAPTPGRLPVELPGLYPLGHGLDLAARP